MNGSENFNEFPPWLQEVREGVRLRIRLIPRGASNRIEGPLGDQLKIRLQAPPIDGKANKALIKFLAKRLDLPTRSVILTHGEKNRSKQLLIQGLPAPQVHQRLR